MMLNGVELKKKFKLEDMIHEYHCPKHGVIKTFTEGCYLCSQEEEEERQRLNSERIKREIEESNLALQMNSASVPEIYLKANFSNYSVDTDEHRAMLQKAKLLVSDALRFLTFIGKTGTGKTRLACSILYEMVKKDKSILYTTERQISSKVRSCWNRSSKFSEDDVIAMFIAPDVLVIDEIRGTDWDQFDGAVIAAIIDGRWMSLRKKTILAGNVTVDQLKRHFEDRTLSRLSDHGCVYVCVGEDQRRL